MDELLFGVYYNENTNLEHSLDFKVADKYIRKDWDNRPPRLMNILMSFFVYQRIK